MKKHLLSAILAVSILLISTTAFAGYRIKIVNMSQRSFGSELVDNLANSLSRYGHTITQDQPDYVAVATSGRDDQGTICFSVVWLTLGPTPYTQYINNWIGTIPLGFRISDSTDWFAREGLEVLLGK